jgi:hypothetical protein
MGLQVDPPFGLGQTLGIVGNNDSLWGLASGASYGDNWVGAVKEFTDVNPINGQVRSNRRKVCIACRNTSGAALLPKRVVRLAGSGTALYGAADGYASAANEAFCGVVDEFLPAAGVASNDVFWVTVDGPTEVSVALSGTDIAVRDRLSVITAATSGATTAGRVTVSPLSSSTAGANDNGIGVIAFAASSGAATGSAVLALVKTRAS